MERLIATWRRPESCPRCDRGVRDRWSRRLAASLIEQLSATFSLRVVRVLHFDPRCRAVNGSVRADHRLADDALHIAHTDLCIESLAPAFDVIDKQNSIRWLKM